MTVMPVTVTVDTAAVTLDASAKAATSRRVQFESGGQRLVGDLYLPKGHHADTRLPAVVVTGAWTTVKEQMAGRYAAELAARGYVALAFDFRGWGQSEGDPRQLEDPETKTQDIVAAAVCLATQPEVDPARIGGLGICASSGYMADATVRSPAIRALSLVAPWLHDRPIVEATYGGEAGIALLVGKGREAAAAFQRTGNPVMAKAASTTDDQAIMQDAPYYTDHARGLIPEYINQFNMASWEPWLTYNGVRFGAALTDPVAIVHSEAAAVPDGAHRFFASLRGPKSELWLDGITQLDFYDQEEPVKTASDAVARHFATALR